MSQTVDRQSAADALHLARKSLKPVAPVRETHHVSNADDAYMIQEINTKRYLAEGRRLVGRKIGLTSKAVQQQLGVDEPDFGMLWGDSGYADGDALPMSSFMQPKIEAEIAFVLDRDLAGEQLGLQDVMGAIAYALPAFEIVDSAVAAWNIRLVDTIADNASAGGYVLGTRPRALSDVDLRLCGMVLTQNGAAVATGVGAACLGHPFNAVLWLAKKMNAVGRPLHAGDLILSGALGPMVAINKGDRFTMEIQGFSPLNLSVEG
jgi:2-keto-4-pentenoate hydratase